MSERRAPVVDDVVSPEIWQENTMASQTIESQDLTVGDLFKDF